MSQEDMHTSLESPSKSPDSADAPSLAGQQDLQRAHLPNRTANVEGDTLNARQGSRKRQKCVFPDCTKAYTGDDCDTNLRRHVRDIHEKKSWLCPEMGCHYASKR